MEWSQFLIDKGLNPLEFKLISSQDVLSFNKDWYKISTKRTNLQCKKSLKIFRIVDVSNLWIRSRWKNMTLECCKVSNYKANTIPKFRILLCKTLLGVWAQNTLWSIRVLFFWHKTVGNIFWANTKNNPLSNSFLPTESTQICLVNAPSPRQIQCTF